MPFREPTSDEWRDMHPRVRREVQDQIAAEAHKRRQAIEEASRALDVCAVPLCENEPARHLLAHMPVCSSHALEIWGAVDELENRKPLTEHRLNREVESRRKQQREQAAAESRRLAPGWIYYIRIDQRIKIGFSADVRDRMRAYPPNAELLAVHPGTRALEADMHARFAGHRAAGREWFRPDPEVMTHISQVIEEFGPPAARHIYRYREGTPQRIKAHRRARS